MHGVEVIDLYTWTTPNGRKVSIMLEELGLPYRVNFINIIKDEQFTEAFVKISPSSLIPAIVDPDGPGGRPVSVFESGAILVYLAEKFGQFYPSEPLARTRTTQWLMWQMGNFGPMLGQAHHYLRFNPGTAPHAEQRYHEKAERLYGELDRHLAMVDYVAGADYTIADVAIYPWVARHEWHQIPLDDFPNVQRWYDRVGARPAVARGMAVAPKR